MKNNINVSIVGLGNVGSEYLKFFRNQNPKYNKNALEIDVGASFNMRASEALMQEAINFATLWFEVSKAFLLVSTNCKFYLKVTKYYCRKETEVIYFVCTPDPRARPWTIRRLRGDGEGPPGHLGRRRQLSAGQSALTFADSSSSRSSSQFVMTSSSLRRIN